ncbi:NAD-dependent DNA ligase LigA [Rariglobus hedericola]
MAISLSGVIRRWFLTLALLVVLIGLGSQGLSAADSNERLIWLRAEIARHDELYFKKAAPEITDSEYDTLKRELRTLEKTQQPVMGDDRSGDFATQRHRQPMLSLEKAYTAEELRTFINKAERTLRREDVVWVIEPKFDGLAISVTYEGGNLVRAVTRGNGLEGDDVTANVLTITAIPRQLPAGAPAVVEVRGEVFIDYAEFARINVERDAAGEESFAHPRNLAAGTLKSKDPAEVGKRRLSAVFYGLGVWEGAEKPPATQQALHARFKAWGLPGVDKVTVVKEAAVWSAVEEFGRERSRLSYPTDGVVVKIDSRSEQLELGAGEDAPRWAVAYKFAPERVATRLKAITLQVGRTGAITPVAELDPVKIGGTTITRATLHNLEEIKRRDLRVGDFVYVEKAGEIIPAIVGVDLELRGSEVKSYVLPEKCPECGVAFVREGTSVRCANNECGAQVRRRIEYFASPSGVGIGGLGPALIDTLVAKKKLTGVADIYRLRSEDGVSARVLAEIEKSRRVDLARLIGAMGLPGVGKKGATALAVRYRTLDELVQAEELSEESRTLLKDLMAAGVTSSVPGVLEKK